MSEPKRLGPDQMGLQCICGEHKIGDVVTMFVHRDSDSGKLRASQWRVIAVDGHWVKDREHVMFEMIV
jgi:hypothetical protein